MNAYFEALLPMALAICFAVLKIAIKNPEAKESVRAAMRKLHDVIELTYPDEFPPK